MGYPCGIILAQDALKVNIDEVFQGVCGEKRPGLFAKDQFRHKVRKEKTDERARQDERRHRAIILAHSK